MCVHVYRLWVVDPQIKDRVGTFSYQFAQEKNVRFELDLMVNVKIEFWLLFEGMESRQACGADD